VESSTFYTDTSRQLQDHFDTRRLADLLERRSVSTVIDAQRRAFIAACDMFFLATVDSSGFPTVSYKGGDPGFVTLVDDTTLAFPSYDGNGMFLSMGNILANPHVGMLFVDFAEPNCLRVQGNASIRSDDPLLETYREAQLVVRVAVQAVFGNCARYVHRMRLEARSEHVPRAGRPTPVAGWKELESVRAHLPADDPARGDSRVSRGARPEPPST